jgi:hypothetical protein
MLRCAFPCRVVFLLSRCPVSGDELLGLAHLTCLTKLSACAMSPELDNKQAALLTHLHSLQHLVRHATQLLTALRMCTCV